MTDPSVLLQELRQAFSQAIAAAAAETQAAAASKPPSPSQSPSITPAVTPAPAAPTQPPVVPQSQPQLPSQLHPQLQSQSQSQSPLLSSPSGNMLTTSLSSGAAATASTAPAAAAVVPVARALPGGPLQNPQRPGIFSTHASSSGGLIHVAVFPVRLSAGLSVCEAGMQAILVHIKTLSPGASVCTNVCAGLLRT